MANILVVEDDKNTAQLMKEVLEHNGGYDIFLAENGIEALEVIDRQYIDMIVLDIDIIMPEMDGYEFTEQLRSINNLTPILMVTAKQQSEDKYKAFLVGADDYMVKPVDENEMLLRIKALLRRAGIASENKLQIGKVTLDYNGLTVSRECISRTLPQKEFYLLYKLLSYPDRIFTRAQLINEIWGMDSETIDTTVNVHVNRLRKKFGEWPEFEIVTIRGIGYKAVITC